MHTDRHSSNDLVFPMPGAASALCLCLGYKLAAVGASAHRTGSASDGREWTWPGVSRIYIRWPTRLCSCAPIRSASLRPHVTFRIAQITRRRLLLGFDKCGSDTSGGEPAGFFPSSHFQHSVVF